MPEIHVPALVEEGRVVIPEVWLGDTECRTDNGRALSSVEYNAQMKLPTLAELRHAFFGGSEDYRKSVLDKPGHDEWTATFLHRGKAIDVLDSEALVAEVNGWIEKNYNLIS